MRAYLYVVFSLIAGCGWQDSSNYCPGNPHNNCKNEPGTCDTDEDCSGLADICSAEGRCVQCTTARADACTGDSPVCSADGACAPCSEHAQCSASSNVCLPSGACADAGNVAYVEAGRTGTPPCAQGAPCGTLAQGLASMKPNVKITGVVMADAETTIEARVVALLGAPGAQLGRTSTGRILLVRGTGTEVSIHGLAIAGQAAADGDLVRLEAGGGSPTLSLARAKITGDRMTGNVGLGISASGGRLNVSRSVITGNAGGGIAVAGGTFGIIGNVFYDNGNQNGIAGGLSINASRNSNHRLEFNSFNRNQRDVGRGAALDCDVAEFTARNNIFGGNGTLDNTVQVSGTCAHEYTIIHPGPAPSGRGNSALDPMFENPMMGNLHLKAGSPALGAADPNSSLMGPAERDIDGDRRSAPADLGADEVP